MTTAFDRRTTPTDTPFWVLYQNWDTITAPRPRPPSPVPSPAPSDEPFWLLYQRWGRVAGPILEGYTISNHPQAFWYLLEVNRSRLENLAKKFVKDMRSVCDWEDILHEAVSKAATGLVASKADPNIPIDSEAANKLFVKWMGTVMRNVWFDYLRDHYKKARRQDLGFDLDSALVEDISEGLRGLTIVVQEALAQLLPEHLGPIVLCDMYEMPANVASLYLNIGVPCLKARLYRGRMKLKEILSASFNEDGTTKELDDVQPGTVGQGGVL